MPSNKPRIQALVTDQTYKKFKKICDIENRSESYIGGKAIEYYVKCYKEENGEIQISEDKQ